MQNMLRAKQISTLSSNARSFFLSGSRCNAADGNSCTCAEDETCVSRRQQRKNEDLLVQKQKPSSIVAKTTSHVVETLVSGNLANGPASHKAGGVEQSGRVQQIRSTSYAPSKSDSVTYACVIDGVDDHVAQSTSLNTDQFYRAGIAAVNFLSDTEWEY
ncbi:Pentatricopeptide repeat-containing protein, partial [Mucuna pruriens]